MTSEISNFKLLKAFEQTVYALPADRAPLKRAALAG